MLDPTKIPVIVSIGETIDRGNTKEPRALLLEAVQAAGSQAPGVLSRVDSVDVVSIISWRYADIARVLAEELNISPTRALESVPGGEKPIRLLGEAAARIASGASEAALICGAEATRTRARAAQSREDLPWGPTDHDARPISALDFVTPHAARYGLIQPLQIYPLYENATRYAWGQSVDEADAESATLWSRYSDAAAANPYAWLREHVDAEQIRGASSNNRLVAYPYRKLMVANPMVNQGAAILLTNLAAALQAGVGRDQLVYVWNGARANEPQDFLLRACYDRSSAQDAVLQATLAEADMTAGDIDMFELYSCFPAVPKMARRALSLGADLRPSIAGGLTFFGGPANNYMTHAVAAAVRAIRARLGRTALLYGQGEFVTKHAALLLADRSPVRGPVMHDVQQTADAAAGPAPRLLQDYTGEAAVETFTIVYDRAGSPVHAPVLVRTPDGSRAVTHVPGADAAMFAYLSDPTQEPIGASGRVVHSEDGRLRFVR